MNNFKIVLAAVIGIAIVGTATMASAQNTKQGYATAVRVQGNATYSLGQGLPEYPLVAGKYLPPGAIIFTKDNATVDLVLGKSIDLPQAKWAPDTISPAADTAVRGYVTYKPQADQNAVRLTPNSTLAIDKLTVVDTGADAVSDTELDLKKGKIFASVRKLSGASQYIVKLPNGIAGVRGTLFSISADGTVACLESTGGGVIVALTLADGSTQTFLVGPGYLLDPTTGQPVVLPPGLQSMLNAVFDALRTTYFEQTDFDEDHTNHHISPTSGHHHGGGNSGNGQGNQ